MKMLVSSLILMAGFLFGAEVEVDSPKRITREWEEKVFGIKYDVTTLDNAVAEMTEGLIDDKFNKAFIARVKAEIEKHPTGEGEYVEYWNCGRIKARLPYKDGKAHGHLHGWYLSGSDAFKGYFNEGVKQGVHITFFCSKDLCSSYHARLLTFNEKGQLHGKQDLWHPTNWLWIALYYKNGKAHGALEGWDINRRYFLGAQYKKNILQKKPPPPPGSRGIPTHRIDEKYVDEITLEFIKAAKKEFGVSPWGSGASMPFDVEKISVDFNICKKASIEEARVLLVKLTERLTEIMNKHEKIRPYLREYPCPPYRARIYLQFCDKQGRMCEENTLSRVLLGNDNQVLYGISTKSEKLIKNIHVEPYDTAAEIVHAQKE
ncbi:MAG: hypothetical protein SP1CHLAM9_06570 [Chlamydiia bacterium]|nr:hypothetical protein [Chlamydiia bacterium]